MLDATSIRCAPKRWRAPKANQMTPAMSTRPAVIKSPARSMGRVVGSTALIASTVATPAR